MKPSYEELEAQAKQLKIDADCYKKGMEASNARLVQIAAELSAIDAIHNNAVFITDEHYEQCPSEVQKIIGTLAVLQIPAYQAFLAEVRASALDEFARVQDEQAKKYYEMSPGCTAQDECQFAASQAWYFAECIRKGVQS